MSFVDPLLRDEYLARLICERADVAWADTDEFARCIFDVQRQTVRFGVRQAVAAAVVQVLAADGVDVLAHFSARPRSSDGERQQSWSVYHVLCDILPNLENTPSRLVGAGALSCSMACSFFAAKGLRRNLAAMYDGSRVRPALRDLRARGCLAPMFPVRSREAIRA